MKNIIKNIIFNSMLIGGIHSGISQTNTKIATTQKETAGVLLDNHNAIIEESIENIVQKYGPKEGIELIGKHLLIEINKVRTKQKLPKLVENSCLTNAAQLHATFLENNVNRYYGDGTILHNPHLQYIDKNNMYPYQRIENAGYKNTRTGENIIHNATTIKSAVEGWVNSPVHFAVMSNPEYTQAGCGITIKNKMRVMTFGKPAKI